MALNSWCEILGIEVPRLEAVKHHAEASSYSLLLVALLERGEPMTLPEVARAGPGLDQEIQTGAGPGLPRR
jgi:hypothetical protein